MRESYADTRAYWTRERIENWLGDNAYLFSAPSVFLGDELNSAKHVHPYPEQNGLQHHVCVVCPSNCSGMAGNLGVEVIYGLLREEPGVQVERCYFHETPKDQKIWEKAGLPYCSVEHKHPLSAFGVLACTIPAEGFDINVAHMLHASGIPVMAKDRTEDDPIVVRGGSDSYGVATTAGWFDAIYIGDGEVNAVPGMRILWDKSVPKGERLLSLARRVPGWFVPSLYDEHYDSSGRVTGWDKLDPDIPDRIQRQWIKDLDTAYQVTKPIVTYVEQSYSEATFLISRGCTNHCAFCAQSYQWSPYREMSRERVLEVAKTLYANTGSTRVIPVAFCSSSYSERKQLLADLYTSVSDQIKLISQRVDEVADDPEFLAMSEQLGNTAISFGIEGCSQRLRDAVSKNITEEQILQATAHAIKTGYHRIKYFLIANLPGETQADIDEILVLGEKIRKLVREDLQSEAIISFSWTPLMVQPFAPLQWSKPSFERESLDGVLEGLRGMGFTVRVGPSGRTGHRVLVHIMNLGDRRAAEPLRDMVVKHDLKRWWNINESALGYYKQVFADYDLDPEALWLREHGRDEVLPWDFIDIGVTKAYLWKLWDHYQWWVPVPKCTTSCTKCGVCDRKAKAHIQETRLRSNLDYGTDLSKVTPVTQRRIVSIARLRLDIDQEHRFVSSVYWKFAMRRAASLAGIQIHKKYLPMFSDSIHFQPWVYGVDYMDLGLGSDYIMGELADSLNEHLIGIRVVAAQSYGLGLKAVDDEAVGAWYRVLIDRDPSWLQKRIDLFLGSSEWIMKRKLPIMRKSFRIAKRDVRESVVESSCWLETQGPELYCVFILRGSLSPGEFVRTLLGTTEQRAFKLPIERLDVLSAVAFQGQDDVFRPRCSVCGKTVEVNVLGQSIGPNCIRHTVI